MKKLVITLTIFFLIIEPVSATRFVVRMPQWKPVDAVTSAAPKLNFESAEENPLCAARGWGTVIVGVLNQKSMCFRQERNEIFLVEPMNIDRFLSEAFDPSSFIVLAGTDPNSGGAVTVYVASKAAAVLLREALAFGWAYLKMVLLQELGGRAVAYIAGPAVEEFELPVIVEGISRGQIEVSLQGVEVTELAPSQITEYMSFFSFIKNVLIPHMKDVFEAEGIKFARSYEYDSAGCYWHNDASVVCFEGGNKSLDLDLTVANDFNGPYIDAYISFQNIVGAQRKEGISHLMIAVVNGMLKSLVENGVPFRYHISLVWPEEYWYEFINQEHVQFLDQLLGPQEVSWDQGLGREKWWEWWFRP